MEKTIFYIVFYKVVLEVDHRLGEGLHFGLGCSFFLLIGRFFTLLDVAGLSTGLVEALHVGEHGHIGGRALDVVGGVGHLFVGIEHKGEFLRTVYGEIN